MNTLADKPVVEVDRYPFWIVWTVDQCSTLAAIQFDLVNRFAIVIGYVQLALFWINIKTAYPSTCQTHNTEKKIITTKSCPDTDNQ